MRIQGGWTCFSFSVKRCFIRIDMLWDSGSFIFNPRLCFGKNNVLLAIDSGGLFYHRYLSMILCISCNIFFGIRKMLLRKVVLASIKVVIRMDFPYKDICLVNIYCI